MLSDYQLPSIQSWIILPPTHGESEIAYRDTRGHGRAKGDTFANDEVFIIAEKASARGEVRRCRRYERQRAKV